MQHMAKLRIFISSVQSEFESDRDVTAAYLEEVKRSDIYIGI